jgi:hypothetical protein
MARHPVFNECKTLEPGSAEAMSTSRDRWKNFADDSYASKSLTVLSMVSGEST